jgi:branched-chain amino acid transport system permease protein
MSANRNKILYYLVGSILLIIFPLVVTNPYYLHVVDLSLIFAILATSLNVVTGYSGLLSLGQQAFYGVGAYASALLAVKLNAPFPLALLAGAFMAALVSYAIGGITLRLRSAYFVISTIAFSEVLRLVCLNWYSLTNGPLGITGIPSPSIGPFVFDTGIKFYFLVLVILIICVFVTSRLVNSHIGRVLVGLRDSEYMAKSVGINPFHYLMISLVIGGAMAGAAGSLYAHFQNFLSPDVFYFAITINLIVMVVGGGIGTLSGPILGAFVFTILPEVLRASDQYRLIIFAILLILMVRFIPGGIVPYLALAWEKIKKLKNVQSQVGSNA